MPGESKTSSRRIAARERQLAALELRKQGHTYDAIAKQLDFNSYQAAASAIEAALQRVIQRPTEEVRKLELERLDNMLRGLMFKIGIGDPQAVNSALRIMDRRAKLLGLDAPLRIEDATPRKESDYSSVPKPELERLYAEIEAAVNGHQT